MVTGPIAWFPDSPLGDALHSYDTEIALRALADHPAQKEEPAMTTTHPAPSPTQLNNPVARQDALDRLQDAHNRLAGQVSQYANQLRELMELVEQLMEDQTTLEEKVTELASGGTRTKSRDDTNDRILAYLRDSIPGVWISPSAVAANLDADRKSVGGRLERMSREGGLSGQRVERKGGRGSGTSPLYRVVPPPKPAQESSDGH